MPACASPSFGALERSFEEAFAARDAARRHFADLLRSQLIALPHGLAARAHRRAVVHEHPLRFRRAGAHAAGAPRRAGPRAASRRHFPRRALARVLRGTFSFAYLRLPASAGALILFGVVQLTMTSWGLLHGERPATLQWLGHALAFAGLLLLTLPGLEAPDPRGALLMTCAGVGWAFYSLHGRKAKSP